MNRLPLTRPQLRLLVATVALVAVATSAIAVATSSETNNRTGLEANSSTYYASANERLTISYTAGDGVEIDGDGLINNQNTQNWTVWAKDGIKWSGTISGSEDPRWRIVLQWNSDLDASASAWNGWSTHRANVGTWGVVQKDVTGSAGNEYDFSAEAGEYAEIYEIPVEPEDGDGSDYIFYGTRQYSGSVNEVMSGYSIDIDVWRPQANVAVWIFNRGWMTLESNDYTNTVSGTINGLRFAGDAQAWDYGEVPPVLVNSYSFNN